MSNEVEELDDTVPCWICGRTEAEHTDDDYDEEGMCKRTDIAEQRRSRSKRAARERGK